jgi:hypothetical protein
VVTVWVWTINIVSKNISERAPVLNRAPFPFLSLFL